MRKFILPLVVITAVAICGIYIYINQSQNSSTNNSKSTSVDPIETGDNSTLHLHLTSAAFTNGNKLPATYTCDGENVNPPVTISNPPEGTKSLVMIVDDPDAPSGRWVHWVVANIASDTKTIPDNSVPQGALVGKNDFKSNRYEGPCPPGEEHRYFFKLYALDTTLTVNSNITAPEIEQLMQGHILDTAELIGIYERS